MYGATAAKVSINTIPLTTNQACCNLTIDETVADYRYVYYYLRRNYQHLALLANGGAQQNLNAQQIKDFNIILPQLPIQHKIANILWTIAVSYTHLTHNHSLIALETTREWRFQNHLR